MRFMVSYEESESQALPSPEKAPAGSALPSQPISSLPLVAIPQQDSTLFLWRALRRRGNGPGTLQDRQQRFSPGQERSSMTSGCKG